MPDRSDQTPLSAAWLAAILVAWGLAVVDPIGWDGSGPVRWAVLPTLGLLAIARRSGGPAFDRSAAQSLWLGLLAWMGLASLLAVDRLHAWIGTPDRRFGWFTWLLCGGLFIVARGFTSAERRTVERGFVIGTIGLGLYTIAEAAGLGLDVDFGDRLGGPFSQPAYLGAATALIAPIAVGLALDDDDEPRWRLAAAGGATLATIALVASQSRAAWLGSIVAIMLVIGIRRPRPPATEGRAGEGRAAEGRVEAGRAVTGSSAGSSSGGPRIPASIIPSSVGVAMAGGLVGASVMALIVVGSLRRRLSSGFGDGGVVEGRFDEWRVGFRALWRSPIFGHGPEGYRTVFGANVDEAYVIEWGREAITDRAHNGALDVALAGGVPAAAIYLALFGLIAVTAIGALRSAPARTVGLAVGVLAYTIQQQFLFPLSEIDPIFWLAAGLLVGSAPRSVESQRPSTDDTVALPRSILAGLVGGLAAVAGITGVLDLVANARVASAVSADRLQPSSDEVDLAIGLRPDSIRYRFIASRLARAEADLPAALDHVERALERSPTDPALLGEQARLRLDLARDTPEGPNRVLALTDALTKLEDLISVDPNHPEHLQRLGIARALNGDFDGAVTALERAIVLAPNQQEPRRNLDEVLRLRSRN